MDSIARATDPATSHDAADHVRASGKLSAWQHAVLKAVTETPGLTAREYQARSTFIQEIFHRRLVELERAGLVVRSTSRRCRIGGRMAATWLPK